MATMCLNTCIMSMTVCHHICYFRFGNENRDILDLKIPEFKQPYLLNFVKLFRIFQNGYHVSNDRRMNDENILISKITFSRLGLLSGCLDWIKNKRLRTIGTILYA